MTKHLLFFIIAMTSLLASADNYFTVGVNDSLRINPMYVGSTVTVPVRAHFDGRIDYWYVHLSYHEQYGLDIVAASRGPGMDVPYQDSSGSDTVYHAPLTYLRTDSTVNVFISQIQETGYWDYNGDGIYEPYGTVKWEAGDYDCMFNVCFDLKPYFRLDTLNFDCHVTSTGDVRGGTVSSCWSFRDAIVYVGLMLGDVDGNEVIGMGDLTALIDYLVYNDGLDEFQLSAADLNGDGIVGMDDLTTMINWLTS